MRDKTLLLLLLLPLMFYGVTVLLPVLSTLAISFYSWDGIGSREWAGWGRVRIYV